MHTAHPPRTTARGLRRRLAAALLAAAALLPLPGCGRAPATDSAAGTTVIEFWDFPHLPETNAYLQSAMESFERENPGVRIRYTRLPWQDGQQKVILSVNSGQPPDVCGQVGVSSSFIAQDVLEPMNLYLDPLRDDFHPSYIDAVKYRGTVYATPWYKACYVMLLNLDVFDRLGVKPPPGGQWTWDEFLATMKALTKHETPDGTLRDGVAPAGSGTGVRQYYGLVSNLGPMEYEAYSIVFNTGGRILRRATDGNIVSAITDPEFVAGVRRLADLEFTHRVAMPGIGAMTQEQSWGVWRDSRRVAATIQGAWCITAVERYNQEVERTNARKRAEGREREVVAPIRFAIAAPPSNDASTSAVLGSTGLGTFVIFRQKDDAKRDLCAKFVLHLIRGEGQRVLRHENVYPSLRSAGNPHAGNPELEPVFALFPDGVLSPLLPGGERVDRVLQQEIQKALLRDPRTGAPQATPEEACAAADAKVSAIIARALRRFGERNLE